MSANLAHPAVILDHSDYVKSVQCQGYGLEIAFTDNEAYTFAKDAWASEKDFVLATYTTGCGASTDQRTFWLIDHFTPGHCSTCIVAVVEQELAVEDAIHGVEILWGTYAPAADNVGKAARSLLKHHQTSDGSLTAGECGQAPSSRIDGLPTATCNSITSDEDLDNAIGYLPFDEDDYSQDLKSFAPGLDDLPPAVTKDLALCSETAHVSHADNQRREVGLEIVSQR